jgi:hypothetical protein
MIENYAQIHGWMDFENLYAEAVAYAPPGATFVEVGSWMGRSAAFMCQCIRRSGKPIKFFCVDTWKGSPDEPEHVDILARLGGDMFNFFQENMQRWRALYTPLQTTSVEAAKQFADGSLDFVFLDAGHDYESVRADILAWRPKIRKGGCLAGHDYGPRFAGLIQAVNELLPGFALDGSSWLYLVRKNLCQMTFSQSGSQ